MAYEGSNPSLRTIKVQMVNINKDLIAQFTRFLSIGAVSAVIDFGSLNILIFLFTTGPNGQYFVPFKSISFVLVITNSYFLNKYWSFKHHHAKPSVKEGGRFLIICCIGFLLNVSIASFVFHRLDNIIHPALAANIASVIATGMVLMWNFSGYKFFVFKPQKP